MISDVSNVSDQELDVGDWLEVNADLVDQSVSFTVWPRDNSIPSFAPWLSYVLRYVIDCNSHCLLIFDMFLWSMSTGIHSAGWMYDKWQDSSARITMITLLLSIKLKPRRCKGISGMPCWSPKYLALGRNSEATVSFKEVLENARGRVNGVPRNPCGFLAVVIKHVGVSVKLAS